MRNKFWKRYQMAEQSNDKGKCESCLNGSSVQLSEADTFIEFCFERKCGQMKNGMDVLDEWRYHKNQYSKITDTTIYDFQHFSRHDASHSISILESIELVVGEKRIVALSRGDLWLLLEAAYSHDLGMALTGEDMLELWSRKEFKDYILDCLNKRGFEQQKAAGYYRQMDNILQKKVQMDGMEGSGLEALSFEECWPARISNYVEWLVCDYIRKQHGERNQRIRKRIVTLEDSVIPHRLYECVVKIATLHTEDYDKIFAELPHQEKGIGAETVYPRFAAAMLRLGDVLDTDNNRFSAYALEHMVEMPPTSLLHVGKHKAIDLIQISTKKIKVTAASDNVDVCKEASRWLTWIDNEVQKIICNWNRMVPPKLRGCVLRPSECTVYYNKNGNEVYKADYQRHFEVNKQELVKLMIGSNIYDTKLDFIREYLQNAMDASKMQFWQDIQAGEYDEYLTHCSDRKKIAPYDFPKEVYDKYKIKLMVGMFPNDYDNICITIQDSGIGIEKECLNVISNLGSGWKKRERYGKYIPQMPKWLTPTGGFGIGIQSAFMATDKVQVKTKTRDESRGRCITLENPNLGGLITVSDCNLYHNGTTVEVEVPLNCFLHVEEPANNLEIKPVKYYEDDNGIFSDELIENHVISVIENYVKEVIPNSIIPISIGAKGFKSVDIASRGWQKEGNIIEWNGKSYRVMDAGNSRIAVWDYDKQIYFEAEWLGKKAEENERIACYKNVRSTHERVTKNTLYNHFAMFIDILGFSAKEVLKIHRNEFAEEFNCDRYINKYMKLYLYIYNQAECGKLDMKNMAESLRKNVGFQLFRIIMWDESDLGISGTQIAGKVKELPIMRTRLCFGYVNEDMDKNAIKEEDSESNEGKEQQKKEEIINPGRIYYEYKQNRVTLNDFIEDYRNVFNEENLNAVILLQRDETKTDNALTTNSIYHWVEKNMKLNNGILELKDNAEDRYGVMIPLITKGYYEGLQELIPEIIKKKHISGQYFTIFAGEDIYSFKKGIARISAAKQDEITEEGERRFYEDSFNGVYGQAVFSADRYTNKYKELYVLDIPDGVKDDGKPPYLISPITKQTRELITKNDYLSKTKGYKVDLDTFIKLVTETSNFKFLVAWVAANALDERYKKNKELIRKRYEDYLRDMHTVLGSVFGYKGE